MSRLVGDMLLAQQQHLSTTAIRDMLRLDAHACKAVVDQCIALL
jgi:hypothetical protein